MITVAFIYPRSLLCGITKYGDRILPTFDDTCAVTAISIDELYTRFDQTVSKINKCAVAHIQYEASLFFNNNRNWYQRLCRAITVPIMVTLHEVYPKTPYAFAREDITQNGPVGFFRRLSYDIAHPLIAADRRNQQRGFGAQLITVHYEFQRKILEAQGVRPDLIRTIPYPILEKAVKKTGGMVAQDPVSFCSTGFINPGFDYEYLFEVLDRIKTPWSFIWIGGARTDAHKNTAQKISTILKTKHWNPQFTITGIVDGATQTMHLNDSRYFFATFLYRSSSDTLATAMTAGKVIFASDIPLTREIAHASGGGIVVLSKDPVAAAFLIESVMKDSAMQKRIDGSLAAYVAGNKPCDTAKALQSLYAEVTTS